MGNNVDAWGSMYISLPRTHCHAESRNNEFDEQDRGRGFDCTDLAGANEMV